MRLRAISIAVGAIVASLAIATDPAWGGGDKSYLRRGEQQRCERYFLNNPSIASSLPLLGITLDQVCDCIATTFVSSLSTPDIWSMIRNGGDWPPYLLDRWLRVKNYCGAALTR